VNQDFFSLYPAKRSLHSINIWPNPASPERDSEYRGILLIRDWPVEISVFIDELSDAFVSCPNISAF